MNNNNKGQIIKYEISRYLSYVKTIQHYNIKTLTFRTNIKDYFTASWLCFIYIHANGENLQTAKSD